LGGLWPVNISFPVFMESIAQNSMIGIIVVDNEGKVTYLNETYERILGLSPKDVLGKHITEVMPASRLHVVAKAGYLESGSWQLNRDDGLLRHQIPLLHSGTLIGALEQSFLLNSQLIDEEMDSVKGFETFVNASSRKCSNDQPEGNDAEFWSSQIDYWAMLDQLSSAFSFRRVILDENGVPGDLEYVKVNAAFEELYGIKASDITGKRMTEMFPVHAKVPFNWVDAMGDVAVTGVPVVSKESQFPNDRWYRVTAYSPQPSYVVTFSQDITLQKLAEAELEKSERKYRALFEQVHDAVLVIEIVLGEDMGYVRDANEVACRQLGYSKEELVGMSMKEIDPALTLDDWEKYGERISREGKIFIERWHRTKDGTLISVEVQAGSVNLDGKVYGLSVVRDLRERKQAERLMKSAFNRMRRNHLLNDLLNPDNLSEEKTHALIEMMGVNSLQSLFCFFVLIKQWKGRPRDFWKEDIEQMHYLQDNILDVLEADKCWVGWRGPEGIGVLYAAAGYEGDVECYQKELARQIARIIEKNIPNLTVSVGVAEPVWALTDLRARYKQGHLAATAGSKVWPGRELYYYPDLGNFQVLLPFAERAAEADAFIERTLGSLLRYDSEKGAELVATMEALLEGNSLAESAKKLHIHVKTLESRRKRIEQILEISFGSETKMAWGMALKLLKLKETSGIQ
jgi:PAS domain S-box-containing protein